MCGEADQELHVRNRSDEAGLAGPGQENVRNRLQSKDSGNGGTISIKDGPLVTLGVWLRCESTVIFHRMASGQYEFSTRAVDRAGAIWCGEPCEPCAWLDSAARKWQQYQACQQ